MERLQADIKVPQALARCNEEGVTGLLHMKENLQELRGADNKFLFTFQSTRSFKGDMSCSYREQYGFHFRIYLLLTNRAYRYDANYPSRNRALLASNWSKENVVSQLNVVNAIPGTDLDSLSGNVDSQPMRGRIELFTTSRLVLIQGYGSRMKGQQSVVDSIEA
ncbi:hypothetical protein L211DRAFT_847793 [Terfezia boudieri ATCC MYA-4762]|uniref:Uncharacterized protein n=1 Tax=Terfezia boudieri ATCC MYA-4762 TaxID=1051890 RepID=A0A3N4M7W9_9PEZI|nr:hypothetical protein L211DRAFT_847793 [Terfezia boudieri ATCC MYA-4762]